MSEENNFENQNATQSEENAAISDSNMETTNEGNNASNTGSMECQQNGDGAEKKLEDEDERKLFVGGLAHGTSENDIRDYFSKYGEVTKVDLKCDLETNRSRGFGFVTFTTSAAITAVLADGQHNIKDKIIDPKRAMARPKPPPIKKVFVGGVSADVSEESIRAHFERFGAIEKIELPMDKEANKRRAFCFICYETEEAARNATQEPKQKILDTGKECDIKLATPPPPKDSSGRYPFQGGSRFGQQSSGNRGRGRGNFQNQAWGGNQYSSGYNQGGYSGYNQGFNQGYGNNYDYSGYGNYGGGYGSNFDNNGWNYGPGGYNQQQNSGYGPASRKRMK